MIKTAWCKMIIEKKEMKNLFFSNFATRYVHKLLSIKKSKYVQIVFRSNLIGHRKATFAYEF